MCIYVYMMAKTSQKELEQIFRSEIPPAKRRMLDLKVEDDDHITEIAESISIDRKSLAQLLGVHPLEPDEDDLHKERYYTFSPFNFAVPMAGGGLIVDIK